MKVFTLLLALAVSGHTKTLPSGGLELKNRGDAPGCPDQENIFELVWGYVNTMMTESEKDCLRLDLVIVESSQAVHHATFYPATGFGVSSEFARSSDGHLEETETYSEGNAQMNNVFQLFAMGTDGKQIDGTYTMQLSMADKILLTSCANCTTDNGEKTSQDCRIEVDNALLTKAQTWWEEMSKMAAEERQELGIDIMFSVAVDFGVMMMPAIPDEKPRPKPKVTGPPRCPLPMGQAIERFVCPEKA